MRIATFEVEEWMNRYEQAARLNIAETCVDSLTLAELLAMGSTEPAAFFAPLGDLRLTYGDIEGSPAFLAGVAGMYDAPVRAVAANGAIGANFLAFLALVEPGDRVVAVHPT